MLFVGERRYEDDPIIGQRLYREIRKVEVKKGKGKNVHSISSCQWETVSTNLDEFQDVSVRSMTGLLASLFCFISPLTKIGSFFVWSPGKASF